MTTPGIAAPQCGIDCDVTEISRSGERRSQAEPKGWYSRGYIPHLNSPHVIQHITYRLADSLPQLVLERMQAELKEMVQCQNAKQVELRRRIETYLDAGHGSCVLRDREIAACIVDTWFRFDGERYRLLEWGVMPNHCHVMIEPIEGSTLGKIVLSWKNYTARRINQIISRTGVRRCQGNPAGERSTQVWQREYWDRFIRDERHFIWVKNYIAMNPVKAGLAAKPEEWPWSSARYRSESDDANKD